MLFKPIPTCYSYPHRAPCIFDSLQCMFGDYLTGNICMSVLQREILSISVNVAGSTGLLCCWFGWQCPGIHWMTTYFCCFPQSYHNDWEEESFLNKAVLEEQKQTNILGLHKLPQFGFYLGAKLSWLPISPMYCKQSTTSIEFSLGYIENRSPVEIPKIKVWENSKEQSIANWLSLYKMTSGDALSYIKQPLYCTAVVQCTYDKKALSGFVPEPIHCPNGQQNDGSWTVTTMCTSGALGRKVEQTSKQALSAPRFFELKLLRTRLTVLTPCGLREFWAPRSNKSLLHPNHFDQLLLTCWSKQLVKQNNTLTRQQMH